MNTVAYPNAFSFFISLINSVRTLSQPLPNPLSDSCSMFSLSNTYVLHISYRSSSRSIATILYVFSSLVSAITTSLNFSHPNSVFLIRPSMYERSDTSITGEVVLSVFPSVLMNSTSSKLSMNVDFPT